MTPNYARLCGPYTVARALMHGIVDVSHYRPEQIADSIAQELATRIEMPIDNNPDPNALTPVSATINLKDGQSFTAMREFVIGHPKNPLGQAGHLEKFRKNCASAQPSIISSQAEELIKRTTNLEQENDVANLVDLLIA